MNVYDFDKTLYPHDSTADFVLWCFRRYPKVLKTMPHAFVSLLRYLARRITKTQFKRELYRFLSVVPDVPAEVERFWAAREHLIGGPCDPQPGCVVISGSPEFLLRDVCERRGFALIASRVDAQTGEYTGLNCSGEEKVVRFRQQYPQAQVEVFCSDSLGDSPMASLAERAYLVKGGKLEPWPKESLR